MVRSNPFQNIEAQIQRQRLQSVVDDWPIMTDEEKKRVLQMLFSEIRADHTANGLKIEFRAKPIWEPYVEAVLARQKQEQDALATVTTSERKTGLVRINPPSLTAGGHIHLLRPHRAGSLRALVANGSRHRTSNMLALGLESKGHM